jgi:hypothetical protein
MERNVPPVCDKSYMRRQGIWGWLRWGRSYSLFKYQAFTRLKGFNCELVFYDLKEHSEANWQWLVYWFKNYTVFKLSWFTQFDKNSVHLSRVLRCRVEQAELRVLCETISEGQSLTFALIARTENCSSPIRTVGSGPRHLSWFSSLKQVMNYRAAWNWIRSYLRPCPYVG